MGEEAGSEGRAVITVASAGPSKGNAYILPSLGKFSWENSVASPLAQDKTIVMRMDESTPGQVYMYVGQKQSAGNEVERAGLVGGSLYGVRVAGIAAEARGPGVTSGTAFSMEKLGDVSAKAGAQVQADSVAKGITDIMRGYGDHGCGVGARRCYLGDMQAHYAIPGELVEGGQLYMMVVPEPGSLALFAGGLGIAGLVRRGRKAS